MSVVNLSDLIQSSFAGGSLINDTITTANNAWSALKISNEIDFQISNQTTDDLAEGNTNLYFIEAPDDGQQYVRQNEGWVVVEIPEVDATSNAVANTIVSRDEDASFSANTITAIDFNSTSDERLKYNIQPIDNALEKTLLLSGVSFQWKATDKQAIGLIAQEVEKIIPSAVQSFNDTKTVSYGSIIGLLIEAIKDQQKQIDELKNK